MVASNDQADEPSRDWDYDPFTTDCTRDYFLMKRELFGGAITAELPLDYIDASYVSAPCQKRK